MHENYMFYTGCPQKKWDLCLNAHNTPCKWPMDKAGLAKANIWGGPYVTGTNKNTNFWLTPVSDSQV